MIGQNTGRPARKILTRILATGALLGVYMFNTIAMTGVVMTSSVSPAMARGRGRGGWGRGGWGRGRGRGGVGVGVGVGIAAGLIGGAIAADAARRQASEDDAVAYCMQRFKTYNPNTGTYFAAPGVERPCP